ncbi:hypothetical protein LTR42_007496 [Elasticomyces elasticus]|nr:hypothetical protein LTR42_007496 [Elasticomyces elasticus]
MLEPYIYQSLSSAYEEIRLLTILPGKRRRPIQGVLKHVSVADDRRPDYYTVSYVWGNPERSASLIVQESRSTARRRAPHDHARSEVALKRVGLVHRPTRWCLQVPASTEAALKRIRLDDRACTVFIDAACINQDDIIERSQQVAMMSSIYAGSMCNLVYLGELNNNYLAIRIWRTVMALSADAKRQTDGYRTLLATVTDTMTGQWKYAKYNLECEADLEAVHFVLECRWFRRLWALQEASLAPNNTALLGPLQFDLLGLLRAMVWWCHHASGQSMSDEALAGLRCLKQCHNYVDHEQGWAAGKPQYLAGLLWSATFFEKSEPRDGVYAVLGLLSTARPTALTPDYTKSLANILQTATRYAINPEGHLGSLRKLDHRLGDLQRGEIASWALRPDRQLDDKSFARELPYPFRACGNLETVSTIDVNAESGVLRLTGYVVDVVESVTEICCPNIYREKVALLAWIRAALGMYMSFPESAPNTTEKIAIALTTGGMLNRGWPKKEEDLEPLIITMDRLWAAEGTSAEDEDFCAAIWKDIESYEWIYVRNRRSLITHGGAPGLGPKEMQSGDLVVVLRGSGVPFILRPTNSGQFQLVGATYVSGAMWGEVVEVWQAASEDEDVFALV